MFKKIALSSIRKIDFYVAPNNRRENVYTVFNKFKPDFIINGSMYSMSTGETCADAIDEGVLKGGGNWSDKGTAIIGDKELLWTTTGIARKNGYRDFIGSAPTLVIDGAVNMDTKGLSSYYYNTKKIRSYFGWNDKEVIIGCTDSGKTCGSVANELISLGAKYASNLDGGGSSVIGQKVNGSLKILNKPTETRPNSNWILIYLNNTQQNPFEQQKPTSDKIDIIIDNKKESVTGFVKNGRTYIQIRELGDITGLYNLSFNGIPVINTSENLTPKHTINGHGKVEILINGRRCFIDGMIEGGRTYLQIKDFGSVTGLFTLGYNGLPIIIKNK